ncbi:hypothetical protein I4U23_019553 [Adineta vaga]|nr:hypothetical protein I4U23_019553 [Adineta vaga]
MHYYRAQPLSTLDQAFHEARLQIHRMPIEILQRLNTDSTELSHFIQTLPTIRTFENQCQQLIEHTQQLAKNNLKREPELLFKRQKLSNTFAELEVLRDQYLKYQSTVQDESSSPTLILAQLQSTVHFYERSNDEMIDTFLHTSHKDHDIDLFVKKFLQDRQKTIELRCKTDKFFDLYEREKQKK